MSLTSEQMRAFDIVWADPLTSKLGFEDTEKLKNFSEKMIEDLGYKSEIYEKLKSTFLQHVDENGIVQKASANLFIQEAFRIMLHNDQV